MSATAQSPQVEMVRRFNRFYTRQIGVLHEHLLQSPFSLTEVRVLYELANRDHSSASDLVRVLKIDPGYLSHMLRNFKKRGLLAQEPSSADGRKIHLSLTPKGHKTFVPLDRSSRQEIIGLLKPLSEPDQHRLLGAMHTIESLLAGNSAPPQLPCVFRQPHAGDLGWVVQRHGELYWKEYAWDEHFEALVAEIVARFAQHYDPLREHCWIAEQEGQRVGCVFIVKKDDGEAQLRLLLVEPAARGRGIGIRLVEECVQFARQARYRKISLWTNSVLEAARHIYQKQGFRKIHTEKHHSFGHDLVGETWELGL